MGWRTEAAETALVRRLVDGSSGTIPARWTDLPPWSVSEPPLGVIGSPEGWRLLCERLERFRERRPRHWPASGEKGGDDVWTARARLEPRDPGAGGDLGNAAAGDPATDDGAARLLLAALLEDERDE